jgi:hypothetical protein
MESNQLEVIVKRTTVILGCTGLSRRLMLAATRQERRLRGAKVKDRQDTHHALQGRFRASEVINGLSALALSRLRS